MRGDKNTRVHEQRSCLLRSLIRRTEVFQVHDDVSVIAIGKHVILVKYSKPGMNISGVLYVYDMLTSNSSR